MDQQLELIFRNELIKRRVRRRNNFLKIVWRVVLVSIMFVSLFLVLSSGFKASLGLFLLILSMSFIK